MWWIPLAWLGWKGLGALIEWDQKQAAKYRCHICRNDSHTTEEHRRPKFSVSRKAGRFDHLIWCRFTSLQYARPVEVAVRIAFLFE